nr:MAG TPA: hypothetical protein [Caudoviricetes sp.]
MLCSSLFSKGPYRGRLIILYQDTWPGRARRRRMPVIAVAT